MRTVHIAAGRFTRETAPARPEKGACTKNARLK
nr:MAG TPA: hypothetical protein [Caudoviricetes sp.]